MEDNKVVLTDEEKDKIAKKVEAKLRKEAQAKAEDEYEKNLIAEAKRKEFLKEAKPGDPNQAGLVPVFLTLPTSGDCARIDGVAYRPNKIHYVTPSVRDVMNEMMQRNRDHEDQINGKTAKENLYRRQERTVV